MIKPFQIINIKREEKRAVFILFQQKHDTKIAITSFFLLAITLCIPLVAADEDLKPSDITRDSVSMFEDGKSLQLAGNLRTHKRKAEEDNGFTLWSWDQIMEIVPQEFFQSNNSWPVMVATVSNDTGKLTYYTALMPSGVMADKEYFLNYGKRYDNLDALYTALSSLATTYNETV